MTQSNHDSAKQLSLPLEQDPHYFNFPHYHPSWDKDHCYYCGSTGINIRQSGNLNYCSTRYSRYLQSQASQRLASPTKEQT
jgi:hypothetical protein